MLAFSLKRDYYCGDEIDYGTHGSKTWLTMWLHYLRWYSSAIVNDDVSLEEQMPSPPVLPATTYSL